MPHSEISGSPAASASPEHFVAWPRPSSASSAKASTVCPSFRSHHRCNGHHLARLVPRRDIESKAARLPADEDGTSARPRRAGPAVWNRLVPRLLPRLVPGEPISIVPFNCQGTATAGGAAGARTPNLRRARAALSQLSYDPQSGPVGAPGLEPGTSALSGPRSNQLSYAPRVPA